MNWLRRLIEKIGMDKVAHFFGSAFFVLALSLFIPWFMSAPVVLALGIIKELLDDVFNKQDLFADILGTVLGVIIILISSLL